MMLNQVKKIYKDTDTQEQILMQITMCDQNIERLRNQLYLRTDQLYSLERVLNTQIKLGIFMIYDRITISSILSSYNDKVLELEQQLANELDKRDYLKRVSNKEKTYCLKKKIEL